MGRADFPGDRDIYASDGQYRQKSPNLDRADHHICHYRPDGYLPFSSSYGWSGGFFRNGYLRPGWADRCLYRLGAGNCGWIQGCHYRHGLGGIDSDILCPSRRAVPADQSVLQKAGMGQRRGYEVVLKRGLCIKKSVYCCGQVCSFCIFAAVRSGQKLLYFTA